MSDRQIQNPKSRIQHSDSAIPSSALFIDRDGTINQDSGYISTPNELKIYPFVAEALRLINKAGLKAIVVTNQSGVARGLYTESELGAIHDRMIGELQHEGARIDAIYYCPHHPDYGGKRYRQTCGCRKPQPGMLHEAARAHNVDLARSWVIGDKASDMKLAANAGARGALVLTGYGSETLAHREQWPCEPDLVADNLLDAVRMILDVGEPQR